MGRIDGAHGEGSRVADVTAPPSGGPTRHSLGVREAPRRGGLYSNPPVVVASPSLKKEQEGGGGESRRSGEGSCGERSMEGKESLSGGHLCHVCGYQYPNANPSAKLRRSHRKSCGKTPAAGGGGGGGGGGATGW
uniref:Uncharacterized protein n=1 Tax=Oryza brachyantha TaxID=4533 RepID=J3MYX1_ORYBR